MPTAPETLSKRAQALYQRVLDGRFYNAFDDKREPKAMQELLDAGLVTTMGRVARIIRCYVPVGTKPLQLEQYPATPSPLRLVHHGKR